MPALVYIASSGLEACNRPLNSVKRGRATNFTVLISFQVRLLDLEHISVITVRDAFLEEEQAILSNLTQAVGYDVKALMSTVVSEEYEEARSKDRQRELSRGATLRIYAYGLRDTFPVDVHEFTR